VLGPRDDLVVDPGEPCRFRERERQGSRRWFGVGQVVVDLVVGKTEVEKEVEGAVKEQEEAEREMPLHLALVVLAEWRVGASS
jgi:hypothetical protein